MPIPALTLLLRPEELAGVDLGDDNEGVAVGDAVSPPLPVTIVEPEAEVPLMVEEEGEEEEEEEE